MRRCRFYDGALAGPFEHPPGRVLVVMPSWVGDCVMSTPALRALRRFWPGARITALCRRNVKPLLSGLGSVDRVVTTGRGRRGGTMNLARRLSRSEFEAAILLPNSFKAALLARAAGIPRRIGYERDGRGFLLTDKLQPQRGAGRLGLGFVPVPTVGYYLAIMAYLGADTGDRRLELAVTEAENARADAVLASAGLHLPRHRPPLGGRSPVVLLNPGARYGAAKLWPLDRYADLADRFSRAHGAAVLVSTAPQERWIVEEMRRHARRPFVDLAAHGLTLGALKSICARADLMVTNDTGPRHIAAALGCRVVTLFGPTDPRWTTLDYPQERELFEQVFCGPCQKKTCPLDHRCMERLTTDRVFAEALELLKAGLPLAQSPA